MRSIVLVLCIFISQLLMAQTPADSLARQDTIIVKEKKPFTKEVGAYYEHGLELSNAYNSKEWATRVGFGFFYEGFNAGFFVTKSAGITSDDPFFPNDYDLPFMHTGAFVGKSLFRGPKIQLYTRMNMSYGDIVWQHKETGVAIFEDRFTVLEPCLQLSFLPVSFVQGFASVGYRKIHKLRLTQVGHRDYDGLTVNLGIRLGYFHKRKKE